MDSKTLQAMTSSVNEHWNTPKGILEPIKKAMGPVLLDPCSNSHSLVRAKTEWFGPEINKDGLKESWQVGGIVFVNPPYGRKIRQWTKKIAAEAAIARDENNKTEIILLGPARVDTAFFQEDVCPTADKVLLWKGRVTFDGAKAPALFPSFLAYWGPNVDRFMIAFLGKGWFM